jgi:hypothetical protein
MLEGEYSRLVREERRKARRVRGTVLGFWVLFVLAVTLATSIRGHAAEIELGLGVSQAKAPPDGLWWQSDHTHQLNMVSAAGAVGIAGDNWRVGYLNLGRQTSDATTQLDENAWRQGILQCTNVPATRFNAIPLIKGAAVLPPGCGHFTGHSSIDGLEAVWVPRWGPWFAEFGLYEHRVRSEVTSVWDAAATAAGQGPVTWTHTAKFRPGAIVGVGYRTGRLSFSLNYAALNTEGQPPPLAQREAVYAMLRIRL